MTLVYRQEYQKVPGLNDCPKVLLPQEWLCDETTYLNALRKRGSPLLKNLDFG
ncbi:hypothetical protein [Pseudomonas sp. 18173]|uniref:hypothetical protein n=1 Tax=Pseudomonas sp. 18173 TaxID=3390055 RepID=UPI003D1EFAAC